MASERPQDPSGEGIKLSADVKPFVPKFAGLNVVWSESSEACVFPSCATTYYPFIQELPVTEQKIYTEDVTLGASTFPPQYFSPDKTVHPYTCSYTLESAQNVCSVPDTQYEYKQHNCYQGFQMVKPQTEHMCPLPQETKSLTKKKTSDESKFDNKKAGGTLSPNIKSDGYHKRTDKKSRIIEKCGSASKSGLAFTRLDFPELHGSENSAVSEIPKQSTWGPLRPTTPNISLLKEVEEPPEVLLKGEIVVKNKNPSESIADNAANSSSSCTRELSWTPMGYVIRQKLSPELSSAPKNVTSMINLKTVASSADSKTISVASSEVLSSDPSYNKEKNTVHPTKKSKALQDGSPERNEISRKNKKKKEKSKLKCEVLTVQEPPRIEDAEEFPILAVASARRSKVESTKFQPMQQPQNNFKNSGKKSEIPFQLDLGRMLTALEKKQNSPNAKQSSKPLVFSVGAVPVLSKDASPGMKNHHLNQAQGPHNPLDSSAPLRKKGKQRETPKAKKPTSLKKIILKERQERKQQRLQENAANDVQEEASPGEHQPFLQVNSSGETEESVLSTFTEDSELEEQLKTEPHSDTEPCRLGLDSISFPKIHSRRFRDYCSQMLSKEVDACVMDLLKELVRFQDRMYQKDPVKAKTKRRLVLGLREVLKHLKLKKLKCVIISPNCEKIQSKGGLDDTLHTIIDYACEQNIPFVFALNRRALGRSLNKAVPVSVVGIFSYDGAQDQFHKMVKLTMAARQQYKTMLENVCQEVDQEPGAHSPPMGCPAAPEKEESHYIEIWRKHLKAYNQCPQELEESLGASTSQMMNLKL